MQVLAFGWQSCLNLFFLLTERGSVESSNSWEMHREKILVVVTKVFMQLISIIKTTLPTLLSKPKVTWIQFFFAEK